MKNKLISRILILIVLFSTLFSFFNLCMADENNTLTKEELDDRLRILQTNNPFEMTISELLLSFGDVIQDYMTFLFKDELTIDRIIFNKVISLDANFFKYNNKGLVPDTTKVVCDTINNWYKIFNSISIVVYLMMLVVVGIKIILGMPGAKADGKELAVKWGTGIAILFLFPYVMRYAFTLNEALIGEIRKTFTNVIVDSPEIPTMPKEAFKLIEKMVTENHYDIIIVIDDFIN